MMDEQVTPPRKSRRLQWVLGVSLALNLVFIGLFAGAAMRHIGDKGGAKLRGGSVHAMGLPLARSLPPEARRSLFRQMRSEGSGLPSRKERRAQSALMLNALRADPFDPAAVTAIFEATSVMTEQVQSTAQQKWLSLVSEMSAAERLAVADRLEEAMNRPRRRRAKRDSE